MFAFIRTARFFSTKISIRENEITHFSKFANSWWDEKGKFASLHIFNKARIPLILDELKKRKMITNTNHMKPLTGLKLLDVGCGGGLLSEHLAYLGCQMTGIDATKDMIEVARHHAENQDLDLNYLHTTIEDYALLNQEKFDVVVSSETIEHVNNQKEFLRNLVKCVRPGGSLILTTPNKTWLSKFYLIYYFEYVSKSLPKGTHSYDMFVHIDELKKWVIRENCQVIFTCGFVYNLVASKWMASKNDKVIYFLHAVKQN